MSEIEWVNNGNTAIINGWYFHFDEMYAMRGQWKVNSENRMELIRKFVDSDELSWYRFSDRGLYSEASQRRLAGHRGITLNGQEVWYAFFVPPEDHYNKMIQDAYQTYLFERAMRSDPK